MLDSVKLKMSKMIFEYINKRKILIYDKLNFIFRSARFWSYKVIGF